MTPAALLYFARTRELLVDKRLLNDWSKTDLVFIAQTQIYRKKFNEIIEETYKGE